MLMKCTNCGLPLLPIHSQASCPRCGTPIAPGQESREPNESQTIIPVQQAGFQVGHGPSEEVVSSGSRGVQTSQAAHRSPQSGIWEQLAPRTQPPAPSMPIWAPTPPQPTQTQQTVRYDSVRLHDRPGVKPKSGGHSLDIGLIVAGLCVITGALILIFVYLMAMDLSSSTSGTKPRTALTLTASPTATQLPGEQFIDGAQTASSIDSRTARATEPTSTFNVNQKIYVTFRLHSVEQTGTVCLLWYLNGRKISHARFSVSTNSQREAYSYAIYKKSGTGLVDIYWASSTDCNDKLLAQQVNFNVTH
jgi:hypothetical protein